MAYENQSKCSGCGISIPPVHEDSDPAAMFCDGCYESASMMNEPEPDED